MKRSAYLLAALALVVAGMASAEDDDTPNFTDKDKWTCDKDLIERELSSLVENSPAGKIGVQLLYVKNIAETARKKDELRCRLTMVTSTGEMKGVFRLVNQDGHTLTGWQGGRSK